jgi:aminopeptidase N
LEFDQDEAELLTLVKKDDDAFNRWEAIQKLYIDSILSNTTLDTAVIDALRELLLDPLLDPAFKDLVFTLPAESYLYEQVAIIDPQAIHVSRRKIREQLATSLLAEWTTTYQNNQTPGSYNPDAANAGRRALKNLALRMLMSAQAPNAHKWAQEQYQSANNMTDRYGALATLVNFASPQAEIYLNDFHQRFSDDALVIDKWFTLQATRQEDLTGQRPVMADVLTLRNHPDFNIKNPNRARSLIHAFCMSNPGAFHNPNGESYQFWAKQVIELNQINPQVAARLARGLDRWKQFAPVYQNHMKSALELISRQDHLSSDVAEVIQKALHS